MQEPVEKDELALGADIFQKGIIKNLDDAIAILKYLEYLHTGLLNKNPEIIASIITIFSTAQHLSKLARNIAARVPNLIGSLFNSSLLFLKILDTIVTDFVDLILKVVDILGDRDEQNFTFGHNVLMLNSDEHEDLYLTILEKIQEQADRNKIRQILIGKDCHTDEFFITLFLKRQDSDKNAIRIMKILESEMLKQPFERKLLLDHLSSNGSNLSDFLKKLDSAFKVGGTHSKAITLAYLQLLEAMYIAHPYREILSYLLSAFYQYDHHFGLTQKGFTFSDRVAYQLFCSNDPQIYRLVNSKTFSMPAQKESVLDFIRTLPIEKRKEACTNASTNNHALNRFLCYSTNPGIRNEVNQLLAQDSIEIKIREFFHAGTNEQIQTYFNELLRSNLEPNLIVDALTVVDDEGKHLAFYLKQTIHTPQRMVFQGEYFEFLTKLLKKKASAAKITTLLCLQENQQGRTIGHNLLDHFLFLPLVTELPIDYRIILLSIKDKQGVSLLMSQNNHFVIHQLLQILNSALPRVNKRTAKDILMLLGSRDNVGANLGNVLAPNTSSWDKSCYLLFLSMINTIITKFPDLVPEALDIFYDPSKPGLSLNYLTLPSHDHTTQFLAIIRKMQSYKDVKRVNEFISLHYTESYAAFTLFFTRSRMDNVINLVRILAAHLITIDLKKFSLSLLDFLNNILSGIEERNEHDIYESYLQLLETLYSLKTAFTVTEREELRKLISKCLVLAKQSERFFLDKEVTISSPQILSEMKLNEILKAGANDYDPIKLFLNSLFESTLSPDEIIDLLKTTDDQHGWHLALFIALNFARFIPPLGRLFHVSLPAIYLKLLHHLIDKKNCSPQKIADLLTFQSDKLRTSCLPFAFYLRMGEEIILFLDLFDKMPVDSRPQIFLGHTFSALSINLLRCESDQHVALYLAFLEKIEAQGYDEQINQIFRLPLGSPFSDGTPNYFVIEFVKTQSKDNAIRLLRLFNKHIAKIGFESELNSWLRDKRDTFLDALACIVVAKKSPDVSVAYLDLLETIYAPTRDQTMLDRLFFHYKIAISGTYVLSSKQLAYELACSFTNLGQHKAILASYDQKREILLHIKTLPDPERKEVIKNIITPNHSLNSYFYTLYNGGYNCEHLLIEWLGDEIKTEIRGRLATQGSAVTDFHANPRAMDAVVRAGQTITPLSDDERDRDPEADLLFPL